MRLTRLTAEIKENAAPRLGWEMSAPYIHTSKQS